MENSDAKPHPSDGPGCGMALYVVLLIAICLVGLAGIVFSGIGLLNTEPDEVRHLVHGSQVSVWRLQPMRDAHLLALTEVPGAWHDESPDYDGTEACALTQQGVSQLHNGIGQTVAFSTVVDVSMEPREDGGMWVVATGPEGVVRCGFGPQEGGERFARQIETERGQSTN